MEPTTRDSLKRRVKREQDSKGTITKRDLHQKYKTTLGKSGDDGM